MLKPSTQADNALSRSGRYLLTLLFFVAILFSARHYADGFGEHAILLLAALLGGYMALNIGANDAGNNIGPLVGSRVIGLASAMLLAGVFEAAGAYLAGGEVISTIERGIVDPALLSERETVIRVMLSALLAGGLWLNLATLSGTPVSTTHTIVGGVIGAAAAMGGLGMVDWATIGTISVSWVLSPLLGGIIAALLLYLIKRTITYQRHMTLAASRVLPLLVGLMSWSFTSYLLLKGLKTSWRVDSTTAILSGLTIGLGIYLIISPIINQRTALLPNTKSALNRLFNIPLLLAAGLLSFAHGSNDVANAIGPLIALVQALSSSNPLPTDTLFPWLLLIGALGIPLGLVLFGGRLVETIGSGITELDQIRAFCIVTSVSITVLLASQFGLPVSSTHIAVGAIFGIGFLRERLKTNYAILREAVRRHQQEHAPEAIEAFMQRFEQASFSDKGRMLEDLERSQRPIGIEPKERRALQKLYRRALVERSALIRILSAWFLTLPAAGLLSAMIYKILEFFI
ncbi:MAG: inorganic phosphate transporter [Candidatus Thiodiazotropha sp.]